jgi:hypothetical protein
VSQGIMTVAYHGSQLTLRTDLVGDIGRFRRSSLFQFLGELELGQDGKVRSDPGICHCLSGRCGFKKNRRDKLNKKLGVPHILRWLTSIVSAVVVLSVILIFGVGCPGLRVADDSEAATGNSHEWA